MNRKRVNEAQEQLKNKLLQTPTELKIVFLEESDKMFEAESQDLVETLKQFQEEFGEITSVFDSDQCKQKKGKHMKPLTRFVKAVNVIRSMMRGNQASRIVNPEISQKIREADINAVTKYLQQIQFEKAIEEQTKSLKTYARPASSNSSKPPEPRHEKLSGLVDKLLDADYENEDDTLPGEFKELSSKLMKGLESHDTAIAGERYRFQEILSQRRSAATRAKTDRVLGNANQLLAKQDEVKHGLERTKTDQEEKLKTRIYNQLKASSREGASVNSVTELAQYEEMIGD